MTFVSYAQNFEDAVLWRALKHVKAGTYIDVGAQHPVVDSVSKAFYERGWRGIHIEPVRAYADLLRADRPDETVLEVALGETNGTMNLHVFAATGLSTAVQQYATRHEEEGGFAVETVQVPVLTLKSALPALAGKPVHWLKIDVEGFEEQVLKGWDSSVLRPWVMVVEATIPNSTATDFDRWDPLILAAGYTFVYFDGLNRFYLADEHAELRSAFGMPPNVFDDLQLSGLGTWSLCGLAVKRESEALQQQLAAAHSSHEALSARLSEGRSERSALAAALAEQTAHYHAACERVVIAGAEAARAARDAEQARADLASANARTHEWWVAADQLSHEVQAIHASNSWRITAPLRAARGVLHGGVRLPGRLWRAGRRRARAWLRRALGWAVRSAVGHALLGPFTRRLLQRFPRLKQVLRDMAGRTGLLQAVAGVAVANNANNANNAALSAHPAQLSPRVARMLAQLEYALDARKH